MSYKLVIYNSPNYGYDTVNDNAPKEIVIHHWGQDGQDFNNVCNWLCNKNAGASAHYVVEAGKVAKLIDPKHSAWHTGNKYHNQHSIGIECRPEMSDGDLKTVVELVADLFKKYGKMPIVGHKDIVPTACPGRYYKKLDYIKKEALKLIQKPEPKPQPKPKGEWITAWKYESDGEFLTGWQEIDGKTFYFNEEGIALTGWQTIDDKKYYFHLEGAYMMTGWQKIDGKWYYFHLKGGNVMTGWQKIDGKQYYFYPDGHMATDTTIDGLYYVNKDGVWEH